MTDFNYFVAMPFDPPIHWPQPATKTRLDEPDDGPGLLERINVALCSFRCWWNCDNYTSSEYDPVADKCACHCEDKHGAHWKIPLMFFWQPSKGGSYHQCNDVHMIED